MTIANIRAGTTTIDSGTVIGVTIANGKADQFGSTVAVDKSDHRPVFSAVNYCSIDILTIIRGNEIRCHHNILESQKDVFPVDSSIHENSITGRSHINPTLNRLERVVGRTVAGLVAAVYRHKPARLHRTVRVSPVKQADIGPRPIRVGNIGMTGINTGRSLAYIVGVAGKLGISVNVAFAFPTTSYVAVCYRR